MDEHENHNGNTITFLRKTKDNSEKIIGIFNFSGESKIGYKIGVPEDKIYRVVLNSDDENMGGQTLVWERDIRHSWGMEWQPQHIEVDICGNSVIFLKAEEKK